MSNTSSHYLLKCPRYPSFNTTEAQKFLKELHKVSTMNMPDESPMVEINARDLFKFMWDSGIIKRTGADTFRYIKGNNM